MAATPRVLGVLFADVSGSTTLYEKLGDRAALAAVEAVLAALKRVVAAYQGRVVKTIGDEIMAVFPSPDALMQAAVDMQLKVDALAQDPISRLTIRVGFHFGDVLEENGDVFGDVVNTAARLAGLAKGGQVITSAQTAAAISPLLQQATRDLDALSLKGKTEEVRVFEVLWRDDKDVTRAAPRQQRDLPEPVLVLQHGPRRLVMGAGLSAISLGRDAGNQLVIADPNASRLHGKIERRRDKFFYADLSTNGTYLTLGADAEILVRREQVMLRGRGRMAFGHSASEPAAEIVTFSCE